MRFKNWQAKLKKANLHVKSALQDTWIDQNKRQKCSSMTSSKSQNTNNWEALREPNWDAWLSSASISTHLWSGSNLHHWQCTFLPSKRCLSNNHAPAALWSCWIVPFAIQFQPSWNNFWKLCLNLAHASEWMGGNAALKVDNNLHSKMPSLKLEQAAQLWGAEHMHWFASQVCQV